MTAHNGLLCSDEVATKVWQIFLFSAVQHSICQILSNIIRTALYLSNIVKYFIHTALYLSNIVIYYLHSTLSAKYCQILSIQHYNCQILSNIIRTALYLSHTPPIQCSNYIASASNTPWSKETFDLGSAYLHVLYVQISA